MPKTLHSVDVKPNVLDIAEICHEANRAYCKVMGEEPQPHWDDATEEMKTSAVNGVLFRLNNPDLPLSAQHDAWARDKFNAGWVHGDIKDHYLKIHPCLVPYRQLPIDQRRKDALFVAVVSSLLGRD